MASGEWCLGSYMVTVPAGGVPSAKTIEHTWTHTKSARNSIADKCDCRGKCAPPWMQMPPRKGRK